LESTLVLVKAVPRPSKNYQETVCCAGITNSGEWRRLFPVRFRQLTEGQQFKRWQWVSYTARLPRGDLRRESRRIEENTLRTGTTMAAGSRLRTLLPLLRSSTTEAASRGESLALIEPRRLALKAKAKPAGAVEAERQAFRLAARQGSLLDQELPDFNPCPYAIAMPFEDQDGVAHSPQCGDWETSATFFRLRQQGWSDKDILRHLEAEFTEARAKRRIILAMGTVASRPRQWLLLGVLRVPVEDTAANNQGQFAF
jgi:hypothetical protein